MGGWTEFVPHISGVLKFKPYYKTIWKASSVLDSDPEGTEGRDETQVSI